MSSSAINEGIAVEGTEPQTVSNVLAATARTAAKESEVPVGGFAPATGSQALRSKPIVPGGRLPFGMTARTMATATHEVAGAVPEAKPKFSIWKKVAASVTAVVAGMGLLASSASADAPEPWQMTFQDPATSGAQAIIDLHHDIAFFQLTILTVVLYMFAQILTRFHYTRQPIPEKLTHHNTLELIWSIVPTVIIACIAVPSLTLIYSWDEHTERPGLTIKVIGRQWYWSYEMHDHLQHKLADPDRLLAIAEKGLDK